MAREPNGGGASKSTDPAAGTSSATDVSLREYLVALIVNSEKSADQRFHHMTEMVDAAFASAQKAIDKADIATEKRFEGVNEFRAALSDQSRDFITRDALVSLADKLDAQITRNREDLDALSKRVDLREGQTQGSRLTTGYLVTALAATGGVIGTIIVLVNYITSQ